MMEVLNEQDKLLCKLLDFISKAENEECSTGYLLLSYDNILERHGTVWFNDYDEANECIESELAGKEETEFQLIKIDVTQIKEQDAKM